MPRLLVSRDAYEKFGVEDPASRSRRHYWINYSAVRRAACLRRSLDKDFTQLRDTELSFRNQ